MTRRTRAALACGLLLGLLAPLAAPAVAGAVVRRDPPRTTARPHQVHAHFSIATYNVQAKLSPRRVVRDLRRLAETGVDVIALQEMGSRERRDAVRRRLLDCRTCHFNAYLPDRSARGATPVLYRSWKFDIRRAGSTQVSEPTFVGRRGAGPATITAKYVTRVTLRERRTGRLLHVLNNHAVPSVQDRDGRPNWDHRRRIALYRKHMLALKALVSRLRAPGEGVFVTGDLNVNFRRDRVEQARLFPYRKMGEVDVRASYQALGLPGRGTHVRAPGKDKRLIDYVYFQPRRMLTPVSQQVLRGYSSDHRPVLVEFELVGPRRG